MTKTMKNQSSAKHSNAAMTLTHETGKIFSFEGTAADVQMVIIKNEPWFIATNICNILRLCNTPKTVSSLDNDKSCYHQ